MQGYDDKDCMKSHQFKEINGGAMPEAIFCVNAHALNNICILGHAWFYHRYNLGVQKLNTIVIGVFFCFWLFC
jgi:hypothetical protein